MDLKKKTREELEHKIHELETFITKKGIGSSYVAKVEKVQRNVNIAVFLAVITTVFGLAAWMISSRHGD
ncbi:MAG: hypothetical protein ACFHWX_08795 [Bacteroidota bacterium]